LAREWGVPPAEEDDRLFARSIDHWPVFADAPGAVQYFKRYVPVALVSNADRASLEVVSRRFELRFDSVISSQDAQGFKPDSRHFTVLAARAKALGFAPRDVLHVSASVPHDLAPAKAVGIPGALIDRQSGGARSADRVFGNLAELVREHQIHLRA
jgi:FMN phosphatase YigB (HAD superfamily)